MEKRMKAVRNALGLPQGEFGEKLGVSRDVISNLEYGRVEPKKIFIRHLCELLYVNEQWLKTGEGEMFYMNSTAILKLDELTRIFKALRPEFQDYALEQIRKLAELQEAK